MSQNIWSNRKLQTSKRDVKWLHAVSGEWFEEIQKKKFKDDTDVRSLVRSPLTHRLKKKTPKGDSESSRMSSSRTYQSPKSPNSGSSFLKFRSPFAALFSFRKSKQEVKLPAQQERYNIFSTVNRPPPNTEPVKKKFEIYHSGRSVKQIASFFEANQKKATQNIPSNVQLQREAFQVLGDLDQELAKEQSYSHLRRTSITSTHKYGNTYSKESSGYNISDSGKQYSTLSSRDRRTVSLGDAHTTHATYQPSRFYEMYSGRHHSASNSEAYKKNIYSKSPSLCSDSSSKSPSFAPISGNFSSSSLHLPSESLAHERSRQHKPRRIPITSIRWNKSSDSCQSEAPGRLSQAQSAGDLTKSGYPSQQNQIFDLYKYSNSNRVSSSGFNDSHTVNYRNDLTCRTSQNSSDKWSTEYYKADSCGLRPVTKFLTQTNSHWEEENKENSFKLNKVTSQPPSCAETKTGKGTEPMEVLNEYPTLDNVCNVQDQAEDFIVASNKSDLHALNLQTENISAKSDMLAVDIEPCRENLDVGHKNIPVDSTMRSEIGNKTEEPVNTPPSGLSESEPMVVDVPQRSHPSTEEISSTARDLRIDGSSIPSDTNLLTLQKHSSYTGPLFTKQDRATFAFQSSKHSVEPNTLNKDDFPSTNVFTSSKPIGESNTVSKNTSIDIADKLLKLNSRWGSKDNNLEGHRSVVLKHQKGNASLYPELVDQKNNLSCYTDDSSPTITNEKKPIHSSLTIVTKTESTKVPDKTHKMSSGIVQQSLQNLTSQRKDSNLITLDPLENVNTCSSDPAIDRTFKEKAQNTPLLEKGSFSTDTVTGADGTKDVLHFPATVPPYLDIYKRYKSMYANNRPNYVQHGADTNNNKRPLTKKVQTPEELSQADGLNSVFIDPKGDSYNTEKVKMPKYVMIPKSRQIINDEDDVPVTNKQNIDRGTRDVETEKGNTQHVLNHLNQQGTNKIIEINEKPKIQSITVIPTSQIVEEHLQRKFCTKDDTKKGCLNLLKEHMLLAAEPYKKIVNAKEDINPTFSAGGLTPNIYTCESPSDDLTSAEVKSISEIQQTSKTYTCQGVTKRTHIYETCHTDSSKPDVDTVEYRKVVSIYYTLPRKFSKKLSDVSQNNLKNIDQTLENSQAPSALLDKMNKCPVAEEKHDCSSQNMGETSPSYCAPKNILTKELDSGEMPLNQQQLLNFNLIPLQTNVINKNNRPFPGAETLTGFGLTEKSDLADQFNSLHISKSGCGQKGNELQMQRNTPDIKEYSPTMTSPRNTQNNYYTLPNRNSNLQDLERSIFENDVAMAHNRYNLYSTGGHTFPTAPESQDVFLSPTFSYDNLNFTGRNSTNFQERQVNDMHTFVEKGLCKKDSLDDGVIYREDIPSFYKLKSLQNVNRRESQETRDTSPGMENKLSPQSPSQTCSAKINESLNRTRPSYNSEFVQKKMKPINAKRFTFSFDNTGQREYSNSRSSGSFGESVRQSDIDSPSVFCSPKDNYSSSHVNGHHYGQGNPAVFRSPQPANMYRSKSLKSLNHCYKEEEDENRRKSDGSFSSKSYGGNMKGRCPSDVRCGSGTCNRTYSAEMIIDENDNWPNSSMGNKQTPVYTAKAVDYGIFGKEQQEAYLNNVKRTLTEGRLWRPSFLKNPNALRNEKPCTSEESHQTGCKPGDGLTGTLNIYEREVPPNSETDTDTTTDDEYYLDENDKESEL